MLVKSPYNYDADIHSFHTGLDFSDSPSRAQQHFRDECDINFLVNTFARTGIPPAPPAPPMATFEEVFDFQTAMNAVVSARESFAGLSSTIRSRFDNDPGKFLNFVHDPDNRDEAVKLGIVVNPPPPVAPEPQPVVIVNPNPADSA